MLKPLIALLAVLTISSCQFFIREKPYTGPWIKYTLEVNPAELPATIEERKKLLTHIDTLLQARMERAEIPFGGLQAGKDYTSFTIKIGADSATDIQRARHMLVAQGKMEWWPCYPAEDIIKQLADINGGAQDGTNAGLNRQLFTVLMPVINSQGQIQAGAVVGYANPRDTAAVLGLLSDSLYKGVFPSDLKWAWSQKPREANDPLFELYAIKQSGYCVKNGDFAETKVELDANTSRPLLNITLNKEAAKRWENMTATAAQATPQRGCIAILFCGQVLMAPTVQSKISGGKMQLNGAGGLQDLKVMEAMIAAAELPVALTIISEEVTGAAEKK